MYKPCEVTLIFTGIEPGQIFLSRFTTALLSWKGGKFPLALDGLGGAHSPGRIGGYFFKSRNGMAIEFSVPLAQMTQRIPVSG